MRVTWQMEGGWQHFDVSVSVGESGYVALRGFWHGDEVCTLNLFDLLAELGAEPLLVIPKERSGKTRDKVLRDPRGETETS